MTKELFLKVLKNGLNDFPEAILGDILFDYKERFDSGLASGKTEEEIVMELGNPHDIVNQYRNGYLKKSEGDINEKSENDNTNNFIPNDTIIHDIDYSTEDTYNDTKENNNKDTNNSDGIYTKSTTGNIANKIILILISILSLILFGPFVFAGVVAVTAVIFAFVASSFAVSVAGVAVLLAKLGINVIGLTSVPSFILDFPNSVVIFTIIGFLLLFLFFMFCLYYLIKLIIRLVKKLINYISRKVKEAQ